MTDDRREREQRWVDAAWAAGRTSDRNAVRVYMAMADAEISELEERRAEACRYADRLNCEIDEGREENDRLRAELEQGRGLMLQESANVAWLWKKVERVRALADDESDDYRVPVSLLRTVLEEEK